MKKLILPAIKAMSPDYKLAVECLGKDQYREAFRVLDAMRRSDSQSPAANFLKAQMYQLGAGTEQNAKMAYRCYLNCVDVAKQRLDGMEILPDEALSMAYFEMAEMLYEGNGIGKDRASAAVFFGKSAKMGSNALAARKAGEIYATGDGVPADMKKALKMLEMSAGFGQGEVSAKAAFEAGKLYSSDGEGIPHNDEKALYWFEKAANMGLVSAVPFIALFYAEGVGCDEDLEYAEELAVIAKKYKVPEADEVLAYIRSKHRQAGAGAVDEQCQAAPVSVWEAIAKAMGEQKYSIARMLAEPYAKAGEPLACSILAMAYACKDEDEEADYDKALYWVEKARSCGLAQERYKQIAAGIAAAKQSGMNFVDVLFIDFA